MDEVLSMLDDFYEFEAEVTDEASKCTLSLEHTM